MSLAGRPAPPIRYVDCFANTSEQGCAAIADGPIGTVNSVAVSPDGASLYAATDSSLAAFSRSRSGALTYAGCFANLGDHGCATPAYNSLQHPVGVVVSPDGKSVYAIAEYDESITAFHRAPDGSLTYAGCIADSGRAGCDTPAHDSMPDPTALAVSPDGKSVYVVDDIASSITRFNRARDGSLTYRGCFANKGRYGCKKPKQDSIGFALGVTVSPDGRSVYVAGGGNSLTIFHRATSGALRSAGCITDQGHKGEGCKHAPHYPLDFADGVVSSPDGHYVYALGEDVLSVFTRHRHGELGFLQCFRAKGQNGCKAPGRASTRFLETLAVSADGRWVYVIGGNDAEAVMQFKVRSTGRLGFVKCVSRGERGCHTVLHDSLTTPNAMALSSDGQSLYLGTDDYPESSLVHLELRSDPSLLAKRTHEPDSISYWDRDHAVLGTGNQYRESHGTIQLSDDGGRTFHVVRRTDWAVTWVDTAGADDAWALLRHGGHDRRLLHSSDGGETWQPVAGRPPPQPSFGTPSRGLAVSDMWYAHLLATRDGGATWERVSTPCEQEDNMSVAMADGHNVLLACGFNAGAGGESKQVFVSADGGKTWRKRAQVGVGRHDRPSGLAGVGYIYGLSFSPSGAGLLFSDSSYLTGNRGRDWTGLHAPDDPGFSGQMFSRSTGVLLDGHHLMETHDGGRTWSLVHRFEP